MYKVGGLFSGVGGIELGFKNQGFDIRWANDNDMHCSKTYEINHKHKYILKDIHKLSASELEPVDVMTGGFPCQAFSVAGYRKGLKERGLELAKSYKIDCLKFEEEDIVLDCGANYGDLLLYLEFLNIKLNYYAFEPGLEEYKTLEVNMKNMNTKIKKYTYKLGLGNSNSIKDFYYSPADGDSSIIEIDSFVKKVQIEVIKLEDFVKQKLYNKKIKLLKLEAEGAEPEVLEGSKEILKQVEYIAADLGPERGLNQNCTLAEVTNFLQEQNFVIQEFGYPRITALFRNMDLIK